MQNHDNHILRAVRTTSFNNEVAAELLHELHACNVTEDQARRIRCAARQLMRDAQALECVWQELNEEPARSSRFRHPSSS